MDNIPIRIFKNNENIGVKYVSQPMRVECTMYDAEDWATDGGLTKTNWIFAPFKAQYQGFNIGGCPSNDNQFAIDPNCNSPSYWWNANKYWRLNGVQQRQYENIRAHYMIYDYCNDGPRYPVEPPECLSNENLIGFEG